jgi:Ca2+-binding EF-hand superfamily protein
MDTRMKCISGVLILLFLAGAISAGWAADPPTPVPASPSGAGNRGLKANQRAHPPSGMDLGRRTTSGTFRQPGGPDTLRRRPLPPLPKPSVPKPKPAPGEIPDVPPGLILKALDLNRDDALTSTELRNVPALFKKLDTNGDGVIRWDLVGPEPKRKRKSAESVQGVFRRMDRNGDGKLTQEEMRVSPETFRRFDAGGKGEVTLGQFQAGLNALDDRADEGLGKSRGLARELLRSLDADGDGKITPAEFQGVESVLRGAVGADEKGNINKEKFRAFCNQGEVSSAP